MDKFKEESQQQQQQQQPEISEVEKELEAELQSKLKKIPEEYKVSFLFCCSLCFNICCVEISI